MIDPDHLAALRQKANELPFQPGVYLMRDKKGVIIYVGKAKKLKNRVTSYFRALESHTPKVLAMVENVDRFDYILTDSEFEALVLEASLIKLHQPKYNILLKDDKGYFYIHVSNERWRRLTAVKQDPGDGGTLIGPYTSNYVVSQTVEQANKIFLLPTCRRAFPQDFGRGRVCLSYHIRQCMGVCTGKIPFEQYDEAVEGALGFIKGNASGLCGELETRMQAAAEALDFEQAARLRDRIAAIRRVGERQKVLRSGVDNCDILALAVGTDKFAVSVMIYRGERLCDKQDFVLSLPADSSPSSLRAQFILRYYADCTDFPRQVLIDAECDDRDLLERYLSEQAGRRVMLTIPQRGQKNQLTELCRENAAQVLSHRMRAGGHEVALLDSLARTLGLRQAPQYIEAFDISNIGADTIVGGMTVFEGAQPKKSAYRKFTIAGVQGAPDDYASMREMLSRRLARLQEAEASAPPEDGAPGGPDGDKIPEGFARRPDLWLIDGGQTHVAVAKEVLAQFGVDIPVFGMVKDSRHRTRAVTGDGGEIALSAHGELFAFITRVQDETHRYTISFSRKKHRQTALQLELCRVPGIGETRARALYRAFKTVDAIREQDEAALAGVPGMNARAAKAVYDFYHPGTGELSADFNGTGGGNA